MFTDCNLILYNLVVVQPPVHAQSCSLSCGGGVALHSNNEGTDEGSCERSDKIR